jgi:hypothetical protein
MAGQPQDPSWQPGAQDQARDPWKSGAHDQAREAWQPVGQDQAQAREAREAWQQPSFTPQQPQPEPAQHGSPQDTFAFAQPLVYGQPPQGQPAQGYPPPGQPAQGYPPPGQPGQGYPPSAYAAQDQAQGAPPQWSANQGMPRAAAAPKPRTHGEKGFIGSLFDFNFDSMVTPKIIKAIYVLVTAWVGLWALILLIVFFKYYGAAAGFLALIVIDPIMVLLGLGMTRIVLEFYMITFKIHEEVKVIRAKSEEQG